MRPYCVDGDPKKTAPYTRHPVKHLPCTVALCAEALWAPSASPCMPDSIPRPHKARGRRHREPWNKAVAAARVREAGWRAGGPLNQQKKKCRRLQWIDKTAGPCFHPARPGREIHVVVVVGGGGWPLDRTDRYHHRRRGIETGRVTTIMRCLRHVSIGVRRIMTSGIRGPFSHLGYAPSRGRALPEWHHEWPHRIRLRNPARRCHKALTLVRSQTVNTLLQPCSASRDPKMIRPCFLPHGVSEKAPLAMRYPLRPRLVLILLLRRELRGADDGTTISQAGCVEESPLEGKQLTGSR